MVNLFKIIASSIHTTALCKKNTSKPETVYFQKQNGTIIFQVSLGRANQRVEVFKSFNGHCLELSQKEKEELGRCIIADFGDTKIELQRVEGGAIVYDNISGSFLYCRYVPYICSPNFLLGKSNMVTSGIFSCTALAMQFGDQVFLTHIVNAEDSFEQKIVDLIIKNVKDKKIHNVYVFTNSQNNNHQSERSTCKIAQSILLSLFQKEFEFLNGVQIFESTESVDFVGISAAGHPISLTGHPSFFTNFEFQRVSCPPGMFCFSQWNIIQSTEL